jgi:TRAP transporter TAXI family solute receptor
MKRVIALVLISMLFVSLVCGCTKTVEPETTTEKEAPESGGIPAEDLQITIASGIVGSSWNVIATTIAGLIEDNIEGASVTSIPGGGAPNIMAINQGEADLAISYNNIAWAALQGKEPFTEKIDVNAICSFIPYALHVIIRDNAEVSSWREIIDKKFPLRIGVGTRGATADLTLTTVLKEYGTSFEDFKAWGGTVEYLSYPDTIALIRDGRLDGMAGFPDIPSSYIVECIEAKPMKFLDIDDDIAQNLVTKAGYVKKTIPAGTYKAQDKDNYTLGAQLIMVTRPDLPEELAYQITKILIDNRDKLTAAVAQMKNFTPDTAWQDTGAPLHPGAERLYREIGVMN